MIDEPSSIQRICRARFDSSIWAIRRSNSSSLCSDHSILARDASNDVCVRLSQAGVPGSETHSSGVPEINAREKRARTV